MEESKPDFSNKAYLLPHINPEGVKFGAIALCAAVVVAVLAGHIPFLAYFVLPLFLLAYGVFLFFRDPDRYPPEDEKAILSPADGRVCLIEECELPDGLQGESRHWRVSVFMSVFNVHVNRMPTAGEILKKEYIAAGKFFNASLDKASKENERCNYLVKADNGQIYGVTQIAGLVARRIVPQVEDGQKLLRTQRFGLIRFGSRLDVYLPEGVKPEVRIGQIMVAGETVLGHLA
ncbi:MAG: phosphatidylserine decarboxylase family protein [Kiritimatiellae bacterium]|nr:phosphatidylserine decarboxylase family protein [Kiritimatiellia bacterium]